MKLVRSESEKEVIAILKEFGYWDNLENWQYFGGNENNFATIGNQQSAPDAALVEKIVNSVDAVLMKECLKKGIDPEGENSPQNIDEAQEIFFDIPGGVLANLNPKKRSEIAENIILMATGSKKSPCYSIIDQGEGQTPKMIPDTFLSLTKSNKLRIPFVQGKFNMGGTGSLRFCGDENLQLIISRRCPEIIDKDDETSNHWGFTVIRRQDPDNNMKNSSYTYLAPDNKILTLNNNSLPLMPGNFPNAYEKPMEYGSFIKLYEYNIPSLRSLINFDLYRRLSVLLPNIALPVLLSERRAYKGDTFQSILSGLSVRLDQNKSKIIEEGFPSSVLLNVSRQEMTVDIYAFKKGQAEKYKKKEGIIFTINGQSHGNISKNFFNLKRVGMNYISDSILIIVDCSKFDGRSREDLFMNSRDRLSDVPLKKEIERELEKLVKEHHGLRALKERRRQEEIGKKISDEKPLAEILESVIHKSPTLSNLLVNGTRISNPFNLMNVGTANKFEGKQYPSYFKLKKNFSESKPKSSPINQKFRVQFETDANNDYFTRDNHSGNFKLFYNGSRFEYSNLNLWNGIATLNCEFPSNIDPGDVIEFSVEVEDIQRIDPFQLNFFVKAEPPENNKSKTKGQRVKPPGKKGNKRKKPSALNLPKIFEISKNEWDDHEFDRYSALMVKDSGDGYDFYLNMDNIYCLNEIKSRTKSDPKVLKTQYKYGLILLGLSLIKSFEDEEQDDDSEPIFTKISNISKGIAPMIIPMINSLGELESH